MPDWARDVLGLDDDPRPSEQPAAAVAQVTDPAATRPAPAADPYFVSVSSPAPPPFQPRLADTQQFEPAPVGWGPSPAPVGWGLAPAPSAPARRRVGWREVVRIALWARIVIGLVVAVPTAWAALNVAERGADGTVTGAGYVDPADLRQGDCVTGATGLAGAEVETVERVKVVPCDRVHDMEVFALTTSAAPNGAPYPGETAVFQEVGAQCLAAFAPYVGVPYEQSGLEISLIAARADGWRRGDRGGACLAFEPDSQLLGSVAGRAR